MKNVTIDLSWQCQFNTPLDLEGPGPPCLELVLFQHWKCLAEFSHTIFKRTVEPNATAHIRVATD